MAPAGTQNHGRTSVNTYGETATSERLLAITSDIQSFSLWINPSAARELANSRARDIERETRERQRAKAAREAKARRPR
jgi:hypothetical protein